MAASINTNIASINAQRNLTLNGATLNTTMQRLSSGMRINSAKDDAAGLAISERMNTQVKGLTVASRNASDGISLAQTTEGALGKIGDMLQRMRELAVQAGNATNSKSDREALQAELAQLRDEVDRVAKTTSFNGSKLLDGSFTGGVFQVGANSGDNITVGALANTKVDELGNSTYGKGANIAAAGVKTDAAAAISAGDVTITIIGAKGGTGVEAKIEKDANVTEDEALGKVINAINSKTADTGVIAFYNTETKNIELRATENQADGEAIANVAISTGGSIAAVDTPAAVGTFIAGGGRGIKDVKIDTQSGAWEALQRIDNALDKVSSARAELGAIQTRFEKSIENIDIMGENISAARGRITDADFAQETANLSRTQILQQAGTAMVAQANQLPQQVLQLLQ